MKSRRSKGPHSGRKKLVVLHDVAPRDVTVQFYPDYPGRPSKTPEPTIEFRPKASRRPIRITLRALWGAAQMQPDNVTFVPVSRFQGPVEHPELFEVPKS